MSNPPITILCEILINNRWRDISRFIYQRDNVVISGGKTDKTNTTEDPAQLKITLNNSDGRFSPNYALGAYYPYLKQNIQIRLSVVYNNGKVTYKGYRFWGKVTQWPPMSDISASDVYVQITANGPLRQLAKKPTKDSALVRYYTQLTGSLVPIAYWPCEENPNSKTIGAALSGGQNMTVTSGLPIWKAYGGFSGSAPIPIINNSTWVGNTGSTGSPPANNILRFILFVPPTGGNDGRLIAQFATSGTVAKVHVHYIKGGQLQFKGYNAGGTKIIDSGRRPHGVDGAPVMVSVELRNSGGNINWGFKSIVAGSHKYTDFTTGTIAGSCGLVNSCTIDPNHDITKSALAHITVQYGFQDLLDVSAYLSSAVNGHDGEMSLSRFTRLLTEEALAPKIIYHEGVDHWAFDLNDNFLTHQDNVFTSGIGNWGAEGGSNATAALSQAASNGGDYSLALTSVAAGNAYLTHAPSPTAFSGSFDAAVAADAPIAWWKLNDLEFATTVTDFSGNSHTGTVPASGVVFQQLQAVASNPSAKFAGTAGITTGYTSPVNSTAFSAEAWVNLYGQTQNPFPAIIDTSDTGDTGSTDINLGTNLFINGTTLVPAWNLGNGSVVTAASFVNALPTNGWTHLAATWDGSNVRTYINGVLTNTVAFAGPIAAATKTTAIGSNCEGNGNLFTGLLSEVNLYNVALSAARVLAHYNNGINYQASALAVLPGQYVDGSAQFLAGAAPFVAVTAQGGNSGAAATTIVCPVANAAAIGTTVIGVVKGSSSDAVTGVTDSKGNTWVIDATESAIGPTGAIVRANITVALTTSDTITVTFAGANNDNGAIFCNYAGTLTLDNKYVNDWSAATSATLLSSVATAGLNELVIMGVTTGGVSSQTFTWSATNPSVTVRGTNNASPFVVSMADGVAFAAGTAPGFTISYTASQIGTGLIAFYTTTGRTTRTAVTFWTSAGAFISGVYPTGTADNSSTWTTQNNQHVLVPATAAWARIEPWVMSPAANETHYVYNATVQLNNDVQAWTVTNGTGTVAQDTAFSALGTYSLKLNATAGGTILAGAPATAARTPVQPGDFVGASGVLYCQAGTVTAAGLEVAFFNSSNTYISSVYSSTDGSNFPNQTLAVGSFDTFSASGIAPTGAAYLQTKFGDYNNSGLAGRILNGDEMIIGPPMGVQVIFPPKELIKEVEQIDRGIQKEAKNLWGLGYKTRIKVINQPVALQLDYTKKQLFAVPMPVVDEQRISNDITVHRKKGSKVRVVLSIGALSIQEPPNGVGHISKRARVAARDDAQLLALANHLLNLATNADERYPTISVDLVRTEVTNIMPAIAGVEIGDYIQIINLPFWYPSPHAKQLVIGYTETITPFDWVVEWNCTPESPYEIQVLRRW